MNLTITVDDEVLRRARNRALQQGTSVSEFLRDYLESYAGSDIEADARRRLVTLARASTASGDPGSRTWTRDDIYTNRHDH